MRAELHFIYRVVGVLCLAAVAAGRGWAAPLRFVQLNSARGEVTKQLGKNPMWRPVKVGDKLKQADQLCTGKNSTAVLRLDGADSTLVYVAPNTLLKIISLSTAKTGGRQSQFLESRGGVNSKVRGLLNRDSTLEIRTPACMGGVRGTELAVTASTEGLTAFGVTEGAVAVTAQGQEVALPTGTMNRTKPGEAPTPPEPLPTSLEITLEQPAPDLITNQPALELRGRTAVGALLSLNGDDLLVRDDGTFSATATLKEGDSFFTFRGTDVANNKAEVVRKVTLDTRPPALQLQ